MFNIKSNISMIAIATIFAATSIRAQEIKLLCKLELIKTFSTGRAERSVKSEIFEVTEYGGFLSIIPQGDDFASVSTVKRENTISIDNYSNRSKWDLTTTRKSNNSEGVVRTKIVIDRSAGRMTFEHDYQGLILTSASGPCEKIQEKNKF